MKDSHIKHTIMNILSYLSGIKRYLLIGFVSGMTSSYLASFVPILYSKIMESLINKNIDDLYKYMIMYYIYSFVSNLFAGLRGYLFTIYIQMLSSCIKKNVILTFFEKDFSYFNNKVPSQIAGILINDTNNLADFYCLNANVATRNLTQFITITYVLCSRSYELYFVNLCLVSLQLFIENNYQKHFYEKSVEKCKNIIDIQNEIIHDYTQKIDTYKSLGMEQSMFIKWSENEKHYINTKRSEASYYGIHVIIEQSINQSMIMILILFGIWMKFAFEDIIIFVLYNQSVCSVLNDLVHVRKNLTNNKKSIQNVEEIFNKKDIMEWNGAYVPVDEDFSPTISFNNVSFSYNGSKNVLKDVSLQITSGSIIGIHGKSGHGKSTFLKLLMGLFKPTKGSITFDDVELYNFDKEYFYHKMMSFVGQEPVLFTGTTHDNIIGNLQDYDKELFEELKSLIEDCPENTKMSGGQRQRVAICRAFIRKPKILLMDEPTSALDTENERFVLSMLKKLHSIFNLTIIIVSHKSSTLGICDRIIEI